MSGAGADGRGLGLVDGVAEVIAKEQAFASPEAAADFWNEGNPEVETADLTYPGAAGQAQALRLYRGGTVASPTLVYIHGGGWCGGSIALHDRSARGLALHGGCNVVSISYRLAPEHPYPAGLDDCLAAVDWVRKVGAAEGIGTRVLAIGGASAGGNLAAAAALARPGEFAGLLIFYGVLGCDFDTRSYHEYRDGPGLTRARMIELFGMYDPQVKRAHDPLITPLLSGALRDLPRTEIVAAEHDVLRDENVAFADRLSVAGVRVNLDIEPGVTHGFINRGRLVPAADAAVERAAQFLTRLS